MAGNLQVGALHSIGLMHIHQADHVANGKPTIRLRYCRRVGEEIQKDELNTILRKTPDTGPTPSGRNIGAT